MMFLQTWLCVTAAIVACIGFLAFVCICGDKAGKTGWLAWCARAVLFVLVTLFATVMVLAEKQERRAHQTEAEHVATDP